MTTPFKQSISSYQGMALYIGAVLGSGILILPGMTAGIAGPAALISWIAMAFLSIPLACTFAYLSIEYPSSGGIMTFATKAFGYHIGAISGWMFFIAGSIGQIIVSLTGGTYIVFVFDLPHYFAYIIAGILLLIAIIGNYMGIGSSSKIQLALAGLTFLILVSTIVIAIPAIVLENITFNFTFTLDSIIPIGQSAMLIFWSFFGWEAIASLAPEFKSPQKRNIMISTWGAILIISILYIGVALSVVGTASYSRDDETINEAMNNAAIAQVIEKAAGLDGSWTTAILAFIICLGTNNAFIAGISRLGYSLSRKHLAPFWLDYVHDKHSTPSRSILLVGFIAIIGLVLCFIFNIKLNQLVFIPNSLAIATYVIGTAAGVRLLHNTKGKILAGIACILCLSAYPFVGSFILIPILVSLLCIGYIVWREKKKKDASV